MHKSLSFRSIFSLLCSPIFLLKSKTKHKEKKWKKKSPIQWMRDLPILFKSFYFFSLFLYFCLQQISESRFSTETSFLSVVFLGTFAPQSHFAQRKSEDGKPIITSFFRVNLCVRIFKSLLAFFFFFSTTNNTLWSFTHKTAPNCSFFFFCFVFTRNRKRKVIFITFFFFCLHQF